MYDRLLKLLSEAGETEQHRELKRKVAAKKKKTKQKFLFGDEPSEESEEKPPTRAQRIASRYFGKRSTHLNTSGT